VLGTKKKIAIKRYSYSYPGNDDSQITVEVIHPYEIAQYSIFVTFRSNRIGVYQFFGCIAGMLFFRHFKIPSDRYKSNYLKAILEVSKDVATYHKLETVYFLIDSNDYFPAVDRAFWETGFKKFTGETKYYTSFICDLTSNK
jgi:hypothetical protein